MNSRLGLRWPNCQRLNARRTPSNHPMCLVWSRPLLDRSSSMIALHPVADLGAHCRRFHVHTSLWCTMRPCRLFRQHSTPRRWNDCVPVGRKGHHPISSSLVGARWRTGTAMRRDFSSRVSLEALRRSRSRKHHHVTVHRCERSMCNTAERNSVRAPRHAENFIGHGRGDCNAARNEM